jgi:Lrp/AsnC family transcriptional regulator for asnA, asnC and gidA
MADTPLSEIDIAIIQLLRQDGRMSNRDLAKNVGVSEVTVRKRLRQLKERSLLNVVALVEPQKLGYRHDAFINIRVDPKHLEQVAEALVRFSEVRFVAITSGAYDILCAVLAKDTDDLLNFFVNKLSKLDGIVSTETTFSLKVLKRSYDWQSVIDEQLRPA